MSRNVRNRRLIWSLNGITEENVEKAANEYCMESEIYSVIVDGRETKWYLSFCPKKNNETGEDFIGAYLGLIDCDFCFSASFRLGISKTEKDFIIFTKLNKESKDWTGRNGWGNLIKYEKLFDPKNEFINNGQLTLFCDLTISLHVNEPTIQINKTLALDLSKMFSNDNLKDCELHTNDGKVLKCHKAILAARSPVIEAMFSNDMEEAQTNIVKIKDFSFETINQMLRYVYCKKISKLDKIAHDLIYAADKYQIDELKTICSDSLIMNLSADNVLQSLIIAEQLGEDVLFNHCLQFIVSNYKSLSETPGWKSLSPETLQKILNHVMQLVVPASHMSHSATMPFISH